MTIECIVTMAAVPVLAILVIALVVFDDMKETK